MLRLNTYLRALLALLLFAGAGVAHGAAPAAASGPAPDARHHSRAAAAGLPLHACIKRALPADRPVDLLRSPSAFDCTHEQATFGPGNYWLRYDLSGLDLRSGVSNGRLITSALTGDDSSTKEAGDSEDTEIRDHFFFLPIWQSDTQLHVLRADGSTGMLHLDNRAISRFTRIGAGVEIPLDLLGPATLATPARPTVVLLRIEGAINGTEVLHAPALVSDGEGDRAEMLETAFYSGFVGLCVALLIYNLMIWLQIREDFQFTYCLMLGAMIAYAFAYSGAWSLFMPDDDILNRIRVAYATLGMTAALAIRFFVQFIEPEAVPEAVRIVARLCRFSLLGASLAMLLASPVTAPLFDRFYVYAFVPVPIVATAIAVAGVRRGSEAARVLLLAWAAPAAMSALRILQALDLIAFDALIAHSTVLAMSIEALLSALAMALRIKRIARERDTARAEEQLARRLADIDPLTGLLNRRALLERIQAREPVQGLACHWRILLIDIDHFKQINDTLGHDTGDRVLCELGEMLAARAGPSGLVARLGGEEFALLAPASDMPAATALAVLADVRAKRFTGRVSMTISIGVAEGPATDTEQWHFLYRQADTALYAAKAQGRNRVIDRGQCAASGKRALTLPAIAPATYAREALNPGRSRHR
ncbi:MAG TPA: diguanylate cyclase [Novosphingobium sp.]|nr:diguanylate cyclase [Novosphingobium sp.]